MFMNNRYYSVAAEGQPTPESEVHYFTHPTADRSWPGIDAYENSELLDGVRGLRPGEFLLADSEFEPDLEGRGRFISIADMRRTREESWRSDFSFEFAFGQLIVRSVSIREAARAVAMKPFETARQAMHEYAAMRYLNHLAPPPNAHSSFRPLGFHAPHSGGGTVLISAYELSVLSYDNLFWNPEQPPTAPEAARALGNCALGLGYLHRLGIDYGDAQIKNFASGSIGGIRHVDLESAHMMHERAGQVDPLRGEQRVGANIRTLYNSLDKHGIDYAEPFMKHFVPLYVGMVNQPDSRLPEEVRPTEPSIAAIVIDAA